MAATKAYRFLGLGAIHGPTPYEFIGFRGAFISQTPASQSFKFGLLVKLVETSPDPLGVTLLSRFVRSEQGIVVLVWSGVGADLGGKTPIPMRIFEVFWASPGQGTYCQLSSHFTF